MLLGNKTARQKQQTCIRNKHKDKRSSRYFNNAEFMSLIRLEKKVSMTFEYFGDNNC